MQRASATATADRRTAHAAVRASLVPLRGGLLQRKCACGMHTHGGECESCRRGRLQRKALAIGRTDDPLEAEADRIAAAVTNDNRVPASFLRAPLQLSRAAASPGDGSAPASVHEVLRTPGQPLDASTRSCFETRFGHDFSQVRVHTDARAARSAQALRARAYTLGQDIVFADGRFDPGSGEGRHLLAHELAHTLQQGTRGGSVQRQVVPPGQDTGRDTILAAAGRQATPLEHRAWEVVWRMLTRYFPEYARHVSGVRYDEKEPAARASIEQKTSGGKTVQYATVIVGRNFVEHATDAELRARIAELGASLAGLRPDPDPQASPGSAALWQLIHQVVPAKAGRISGSSYDANLPDPPGLSTEFGGGSVTVGKVTTSWSGPKLYFGKAFLALPDAEKRSRISAEFERIDSWSVANAHLTAADLADPDIELRIRGLSTAALTRLRDNAKDPAVKAYADSLIGTSTPLEGGLARQPDGTATMKVGHVTVIVKPDIQGATDIKGKSAAETKPTSSDEGVAFGGFSYTGPKGGAKHVTTFDPPPTTITITIQTRYRQGAAPGDTSGYGRGTTSTDLAKEGKTLRVHEGSHGLDFIRFIQAHPFPTFAGRAGMTVDDFKKARSTYKTARDKWFADMTRASELSTDCVGVTIEDFYAKQHLPPPVHCH